MTPRCYQPGVKFTDCVMLDDFYAEKSALCSTLDVNLKTKIMLMLIFVYK